MPELKELYKCDSLEALTKFSELPKSAVKSLTQSYDKCYGKAKRLYDEAVLKEKEGDEELAFVFFYRCAEVGQKFPQCTDVKVVPKSSVLRGRELFDNCLKRMEKVQTSLTRRYHFRKEKEEFEKTERSHFQSPTPSKIIPDNKPKNEEIGREESEGKREISPEELYSLIHGGKDPKILMMDVRASPSPVVAINNDRNFQCVLVDPAILPTAVTAAKLEAGLSLMERGLFRKRHGMDYVVLMDECGDSRLLDSSRLSGLKFLFNAITQYDQSGELRRPPLILRGGFDNWKLHYPMCVETYFGAEDDAASFDSGYSSLYYPDLASYFAQKPSDTEEELVEEQEELISEEEPVPFTAFTAESTHYPDLNHKSHPAVSVPSIPSRALKPQVPTNRKPEQPPSDNGYSPADPVVIAHTNGTNFDEESQLNCESESIKPSSCEGPEYPGNAKSRDDPLVKPVPSFDRNLKPKAGMRDPRESEVSSNSSGSDGVFTDQSGEEIQERMDSATSIQISNAEHLDEIGKKLREGMKLAEDSTPKTDDTSSSVSSHQEQGASGLETFAQPSNATSSNTDSSVGLETFAQPRKDTGQNRHDEGTENWNPPSRRSEEKPSSPVPRPRAHPLVPDRNKKPPTERQPEPAVKVPVVDDSKEFSHHITAMRRVSSQGRTESGLTGLFNLGNTCYMNSVIQCLSNTLELRDYFLNRKYVAHINRENRIGTKGKLTTSFAALMYELHSQQFRAIRPQPFRTELQFVWEVPIVLQDTVLHNTRLFRLGKQEDSQEFLSFLLEGLHEDLNQVRRRIPVPEQKNTGLDLVREGTVAWNNQLKFAKSFVQDLFGGQLISTVRCRTCETRSYTFDSFNQVILELPTGKSGTSLRECLERHMRREILSGDARWNCPKCRCPRDSEKKIDFWKLPRFLIINLKRDLCLENFVHPAGMSSRDYVKRSYNLYALSNHFGEMGGGHYTAQCYNEKLNRWFQYDDECVSATSESRVQTDKAYILFYRSTS